MKAGQVIRAEQTEDFAQILDWSMITLDLNEYLNYGPSNGAE